MAAPRGLGQSARSWPRRVAGPLLLSLAAPAAAAPTWNADIAPLLAARCVVCHRGEAAPRGLRLDTLEGLLGGSERGPVVQAGDPAGSELVRRILGQSLPRMPLTGPPFLSEGEAALISDWIAAGLPEGEATAPAPPPARQRPPGPPRYGEVAPILLQRCVKCHSERGIRGAPPEGLRLSTLAETLAGGERVVVIPGNAEASELVRRIRGLSEPRMPFDGPPWLSAEEIARIAAWIDAGARDEEGRPAPMPTGARVRLEGTLTGRWELDGMRLYVQLGARIRERVRVGDRVRVEGVVERDGRINVTRIKRR